MRIFLSGATGYIGRALTRRLVEAGHEVRAVVRPTSDVGPLAELGVATFVGDVTDRFSLREGMSGADWVVHAAADLDMAGPGDRMRTVNLQGSENVASLAYKLGVGRLLHVSSIAAFGGSPDDGSAATEESPVREPFPSLYGATKRGGEEAAREWAKRGLRLNVVYPSLVYGPPGKKGGSNAMLRQLLKGRIPLLVGAVKKTSWVFLEDLVDGMLRVIERAPAGRDYLLTGDVATLGEVVAKVTALGGVRPPRLSLPLPLARAALTLAGPLYKARGRRPPFSADQLASLTRHWAFDDARARRELDWKPRGLAEGLPPTVELLKAS